MGWDGMGGRTYVWTGGCYCYGSVLVSINIVVRYGWDVDGMGWMNWRHTRTSGVGLDLDDIRHDGGAG